jgi:hypothetical protein
VSKEAEIRLEELQQLFRQMLSEGCVIKPSLEVEAALERQGLLTVKGMSSTRIAEISAYCKEPDRDLEFREKGKQDLLALCRECLALQTVVHEAVRWLLHGGDGDKRTIAATQQYLARED